MRRMGKDVMAVVLALGVALACAAPANATIFSRNVETGTEGPELREFCGLTLRFESEFRVLDTLRTGKNQDEQAFFAHTNYRFTDTWTDPATGRFFTVEGRGNFREVTARQVEGTIFEFKLREALHQLWRAMDGTVFVRANGNIHSTVLFDTLGDNEPGGEVLSFVDDKITGKNIAALLFEPEEQLCARVYDLLDVEPPA